jgi:DNA modification methylase
VTPFVADPDFTLYVGDCLDVLGELPDGAADAVVTSPPYLDARPEYPSPTIVQWNAIFRNLRRVVVGPMLLNVGRLFRGRRELLWWVRLLETAEQHDWFLLDTRVWIKPNANPIRGEVFADRHEYVFVLGEPGVELNVDDIRVPYAPTSLPRLERGWTHHMGVKGDSSRRSQHGTKRNEPHPLGGRPPSYISVPTGAEKGNPHPAPMPLMLAGELVMLAAQPGQTILDPFAGSGTTAAAARRLGRRSIAIELSPEYASVAAERLSQLSLFALRFDDEDAA